ncbi:MAG: endonuclease domain-containing protein, partial [Frankia sp.]
GSAEPGTTESGPAGPGDPGAPDPRFPEPAEVTYSAIAGRPHPGSLAEQVLERALAPAPWATGRIWNPTHRFGPLAPVIRLDLVWPVEQCVIEIDGADHRRRQKYADDRQRDRRLTVSGFSVLRFTNDEIMTDLSAVLGDIRCCIERRRDEAVEGRAQWLAKH